MDDSQLPAIPPPPRTPRQRVENVWHRLQNPFAILGVIGSALAIYHYGIKPLFLETRSLDAAFKFRTVAEGTPVFDLKPYLRPEAADKKKLVEFDVIIWNSGSQTIDAKEIRREVTMKIEGASKVKEYHIGGGQQQSQG
jgi:hypothetical protein